MNSLFARLSIALLLIIGAMGTAFYFLDRVNTRTYYEELSQHLNAPIAMYVTQQTQLIDNGVADAKGLQALASHAMVINPTAEIYLLGISGEILAHSLPESELTLPRVNLEPVKRLINGADEFPIRGDDPRNAATEKIFSAWPVTSTSGTEGYLYVVLGGEKYETLAANIGDSYAARSSIFAIALLVGVTAVIGLLVFGLLTRRLKRLRDEMRHVTESRFEQAPRIVKSAVHNDEIDEISDAFVDMAAQIRRQIEQLTENDRLRRELISNVSHDLRTPLTAMQGYIETLMIRGETMTPADRAHFLKIAQKHSARLGRLIADLFELSKLDAASVTPSVESFSLAELVQDIAHEFRIESERKGVDLRVNVDTAATTMGDIGLIQRVLENLVKNAIQFAPQGGEVTISIAEMPDSLAIAVSDNGPGIPEAEMARIFDRFYRARDGEEARSDSSGLGLAIVKRILDLHNTRITVSSRANTETRFEFQLPLCRQAA